MSLMRNWIFGMRETGSPLKIRLITPRFLKLT